MASLGSFIILCLECSEVEKNFLSRLIYTGLMVYFFIQKTFQNFGEKLCLQIKCTCVIFIVYALVVAVLPDPKNS